MAFLPKKYSEYLPLKDLFLDRFFRSGRVLLPLPMKIVPVGHRGTITYAPENTIAAHEKAYTMGARCIEFDVRCTKDGHFVVIHDKDAERTTDGHGKIKNLTLAEIQSFDAGSHKDATFEGERVPSLREALANVEGRFAVDIDFKGGPKHSAAMIAEILKDEGFDREGAPLISIFARHNHFDILKPLASNYSLRPHYLGRRHALKMAEDYGLQIMGLRRYVFSMAAARNIRKTGMHLFSNTMADHENETYETGYEAAAKAGALFIQTDYIDRLVAYLERIDRLETGVLGRDFLPLSMLRS